MLESDNTVLLCFTPNCHPLQCIYNTIAIRRYSISFARWQHYNANAFCDKPEFTTCLSSILKNKTALLRSGGFKQKEGGWCPPFDWMHLKTGENLAQKCIIFA